MTLISSIGLIGLFIMLMGGVIFYISELVLDNEIAKQDENIYFLNNNLC
jgi:hypothetical protein